MQPKIKDNPSIYEMYKFLCWWANKRGTHINIIDYTFQLIFMPGKIQENYYRELDFYNNLLAGWKNGSKGIL